MTKKFDVITIDGFIYLIDRKAEILQGDRYIHPDGALLERYASIPFEGSVKIIASNNPSIDVPQIGELPEEDASVEASLEGMKHYPIQDVNNQLALGGFIRGYKAAKAKKYDEVDIFKVLHLVKNDGLDSIKDAAKIHDIIQSLTKPIKSITIEMEEWNIGGGIGLAQKQPLQTTYKPLLDKEGFVIIKEIEYA